MGSLVSICIPTFNRPQLLREAIQSCFVSDHRPLEILIGDDSPGDQSAITVGEISVPDGVELRYQHNEPRLGQPANINSLFEKVRGDHLLLLHDDDRLLPGCIDMLYAALERNPDVFAAYGKQSIIDVYGNALPNETRATCEKHYWVPECAGIQDSCVTAALLGQFPMDGYLVRSDTARSVRYSEHSFRGDNCDYDFGVRLALENQTRCFCYVDEFTLEYRHTDVAISLVSLARSYAVQMLMDLEVPLRDEPAREFAIRRFSAGAVPELARRGLRRDALALYRSRYYSERRFSAKSAYHLASIMCPPVATLRDFIRARSQMRMRLSG